MSPVSQNALKIGGTVAAHALFWGWNLLFLSVIAFGVGPVLLFDTLRAAWMGVIPWSIAIFVPLLLLIPVLGMLVGGVFFRRDGGRLLSLFFGVQFPLMALVLVRIFGLGQLVPSTRLLLGAFVIGTAVQLRTLLGGFSERAQWAQVARLIGQSLYLWMGLWIGGLLGLLLIPLVIEVAPDLVRIPRHQVLFSLLMQAFGGVTAMAFLAFPVATIGITLRSFQVIHRETVARLGSWQAWAWALGTLATFTVALALSSVQPQHKAVALLDAATDEAGQRAAIANEALIRRGLLNARLHRYRYLGSYSDKSVRYLYRRTFGTWSMGPASAVWRLLAWPVTYHPVDGEQWWSDETLARERYVSFFDAPMDRAEREEIQRVMSMTWNWRQAAAGLLDIGEQRVWLESQAIDIEPHGDHATVTVHEVYRNRTWQNEEVLVSFSLPEDAVVTGLWLGSTDDRDAAFTHVVAPRGAAQEVYEQQVRRSVDPALLEQVGPQQYRLRAFPVLARSGGREDLGAMAEDGAPFHVWIQMDVWSQDGGWPLPQSTEVRNLFWDDRTERTVNGSEVTHVDDWTPRFVIDGSAEPRPEPSYPLEKVAQRLGVYIDTSRSMASVESDVYGAIAALEGSGYAISWLNLADREDIHFWGDAPLDRQIQDLSAEGLDAVVVLTDGSAYDLTGDPSEPFSGAPLWLVHLGGLPQGYADAVLDALNETHGGIGVSVGEVISEIERGPAVYAYGAPSDPSSARLMAAEDAKRHVREGGTLDEVHALAVEHDLVTPWSSMIVLVNEDQLRQLADASGAEDRFEREALNDSGGDFSPLTATPEPHEWALMALAGLMLGLRRRRDSAENRGHR